MEFIRLHIILKLLFLQRIFYYLLIKYYSSYIIDISIECTYRKY